MNKTPKVHVFRILLYVFLIVILVSMILPFIWLTISSFRPNMDLFREPFAVPKHLSFDNYRAVFKSHPMMLYFMNTVLVALVSTIITIVVSCLASYAFMYKFRSSLKVSMLLSIGLFIPTNAFLVPYYVFINKVGLYDNLLGIALVYAGVNLPQSIMVIKGYMGTIPKGILEAANIDGASTFTTLLGIVLPISAPGIVTSCIFIVINCWNELLFANLLSQSDVSRTIQVAIRSFLTTFSANYAYAFAAMVIAILPTIIIYAFLTDKIIGGMTAGAVKG